MSALPLPSRVPGTPRDPLDVLKTNPIDGFGKTMPTLDVKAPEVKYGILDKLKGALKDPETRAALLRSGATTLSTGDVGKGILAGADFADQRRSLRDRAARDERDYQLRARELSGKERGQAVDERQGDRRLDITQQQTNDDRDYRNNSLGVQRRGQDMDSRDRRYSTDASSANNQRDNETRRRGDDLSFTASTFNTTQKNSGASSPSEVKGILNMVLPSAVKGIGGYDDDGHVSAAIQSNPDLYGELSDGVAAGYKTGGTSGALDAARGVLSKYRYTPFHPDGWGPDGGERPSSFAKAPPAANSEIRYGPDGRAYRQGPDGKPIPVN